MSAQLVLAIGILGGFGAVARQLLDGAISRRARSPFPWGILAVNLSGSFALGLLVGATLDPDALQLIGAGLLASYTTFSTWMLQSRRAAEQGRRGLAAAYLTVSLVLGLAAVWLGRELGAAL